VIPVEDSEGLDDIWANWMAEEGMEIEEEIEMTLLETRGTLDMTDGTHAQWLGQDLGVLLTFSEQEVTELLDAWDDATDGNLIALTSLMNWLQGFSSFLASCIKARSDLED
tara:strand:+ start:34 stop:366 length:333 start_codon:yes stop_codon:yes gene_type:complete